MTFYTGEYAEDEITEELIITLLEQELDKLKEMTTQKQSYIPNDNTNKLIIKLLEEELHNRKQFAEK